jgi:hypothetical protein
MGQGGAGAGPTSLMAQAVGAYQQIGDTCPSGTKSLRQGWAMFLCPGGAIRAAGTLDGVTDLECGSFTTSPATMAGCTDKLGCFPQIDVDVKDTLVEDGVSNVAELQYSLYMVGTASGQELYWASTVCSDQSGASAVFGLVDSSVTTNYCDSAACPQPGGQMGGTGTCGTDCDCGHCWYCESGTCHSGGEGPDGCYRGCD